MTELNKGDSVTEAAAKSTEYPEESGHGWGGVTFSGRPKELIAELCY